VAFLLYSTNMESLIEDASVQDIKHEREREIERLACVAMRQADQEFHAVGGTTRQYIIECLLPCLKEQGLKIEYIDKTD